ncbi:apolipoprotein N-acyltransferase [Candidatus Sumerlaeota bacterium]|nr:apolipoprotein N-acyltransferase [Candidatus Sumerlaeota bacterium]
MTAPFRKRPPQPRAKSTPPQQRRSSDAAVPQRQGYLFGTIPTLAELKGALPAFGLAILSAGLLRLAYWPLYFSPIAFVALVPMLWGLRRCRPGVAFHVGWLFGSIMCAFGTSWFVVVDRFNSLVWFGVVPLAMALGLYFAFSTAIIVKFARRHQPWVALPLAMMTWAGIEYFMSIGPLGTPYGLAQSQGGWLSVAQLVSIAGMPLLSALILAANLCIMETVASFIARYGQGGALTRLAIVVLAVVAAHFWGAGVITAGEDALATGKVVNMRVALLQPNISQDKKYASYSLPDPVKRQQLTDELTLVQLEQLRTLERREVDLIVTPESTFTAPLADVEESLQNRLFGRAIFREVIDLANDFETPITICEEDNFFKDKDGNLTEDAIPAIDPQTNEFYPGYSAYGGFWLIRPGEDSIRQVADYRKVQLMPFGEAVPYFSIIPGFQEKIVQVGTFARGKLGSPVGFNVTDRVDQEEKEVRIGPSICFEDQFPYIHTSHARKGANLFVNVTNDGWFDGSSGPYWHGEMSRWRSIETRIPMVRCTNTGNTFIIGPSGEITEQLDPMKPGILKADLKFLADPPKTLYARIGNLFGMLCFGGLLFTLIAGWVRRAE